MEKYIPHFERDQINLDLFLSLKEQDLVDMGITLLGPRRKLMNVIEQYKVGINCESVVTSPMYVPWERGTLLMRYSLIVLVPAHSVKIFQHRELYSFVLAR